MLARAVRRSSQHGEERMKKSPTPHFRSPGQRPRAISLAFLDTSDSIPSEFEGNSLFTAENLLNLMEKRRTTSKIQSVTRSSKAPSSRNRESKHTSIAEPKSQTVPDLPRAATLSHLSRTHLTEVSSRPWFRAGNDINRRSSAQVAELFTTSFQSLSLPRIFPRPHFFPRGD